MESPDPRTLNSSVMPAPLPGSPVHGQRERPIGHWTYRGTLKLHLPVRRSPRIRVALEPQSKLLDLLAETRPEMTLGPFEIVVAIPDTEGAVLDGLNNGWEPPAQAFNPPMALDKHILVRVQLEQWPSQGDGRDDDGLDALLKRVADRVCQAFGDEGVSI